LVLTSIPEVQTNDRTINKLQDNIIPPLNVIIKNPMTNGVYLTELRLAAGTNTINHTLGRKLQGWFPVRVRSQALVTDLQDTNPNPTKTLILEASSTVVIDIFAF